MSKKNQQKTGRKHDGTRKPPRPLPVIVDRFAAGLKALPADPKRAEIIELLATACGFNDSNTFVKEANAGSFSPRVPLSTTSMTAPDGTAMTLLTFEEGSFAVPTGVYAPIVPAPFGGLAATAAEGDDAPRARRYIEVYSAQIEHKHGVNSYTATSKADLYRQLADYCIENWFEVEDEEEEPADDADPETIVSTYFEHVHGEGSTISDFPERLFFDDGDIKIENAPAVRPARRHADEVPKDLPMMHVIVVNHRDQLLHFQSASERKVWKELEDWCREHWDGVFPEGVDIEWRKDIVGSFFEHADHSTYDKIEVAWSPDGDDDGAGEGDGFVAGDRNDPSRVTASFVAQAWQNDDAIEVDAEGPSEWDVTAHLEGLPLAQAAAFLKYAGRRDELARAPTSPRWIKDWSGPFEVHLHNFEVHLERRAVRDLAKLMEEWTPELVSRASDQGWNLLKTEDRHSITALRFGKDDHGPDEEAPATPFYNGVDVRLFVAAQAGLDNPAARCAMRLVEAERVLALIRSGI